MASLTSSTYKAYQRHWQSLLDFHKELGMNLTYPVHSSTIALFIAHLYQKGLKPNTVRSYLSAISFIHKLKNLVDPTASFLVSKTLQGFVNSDISPCLKLQPITKSILHQLLDNVTFCTTCSYTRKLISALFLITYYACLRVGEAVCTKNASHTLHISQISPLGSTSVSYPPKNGYQIKFQSYKHSKHLTPTFILSPIAERQYCPVSALHAYVCSRGLKAGPLFVDASFRPLTRKTFLHYLHLCVDLTNLPIGQFNTHSFHIGRVTQLAMDNTPESKIKDIGRWKSNAYQKYIRLPHLQLPV